MIKVCIDGGDFVIAAQHKKIGGAIVSRKSKKDSSKVIRFEDVPLGRRSDERNESQVECCDDVRKTSDRPNTGQRV